MKLKDIYKTYDQIDKDVSDTGILQTSAPAPIPKKKKKKKQIKHGSYFRKRMSDYDQALEEAYED